MHVRGAFQKYAEKSHNFTSTASILLKFMDIIPYLLINAFISL